MIGAAWSAYHRTTTGVQPRSPPTASLVPSTRANRSWRSGAATCWPRVAWSAGDADRIVAELEASRALSGQADPALAARAEVMLANAAFLAGDLADQDRHGQLAIELARTAVGQEGLALALSAWSMSAIAGRASNLPPWPRSTRPRT